MSGGRERGKQADRATNTAKGKGERIAKVIARSGLCSRRDAERMIAEGRVALNGRRLETPAVTVGAADKVDVDGVPLAARERTRLWLFHKPRGLVTTNRDPEGRPTVFSRLPADLPRVVTVGRLDVNTEGLLLLTNDGGLARVLELPATGWLRRYRVRAHGRVEPAALERLRQGATIGGIVYGAVEAAIDRVQGTNVWLTVGLREGKNREVKHVLEHVGLIVNRLIRISYGPFQLGELKPGEVTEVRGRVLRDQLGDKLARAADADFDAPLRPPPPAATAEPERLRRQGAHARRRRPS
jgi:23S rRNA pseudouridine2605 synthase